MIDFNCIPTFKTFVLSFKLKKFVPKTTTYDASLLNLYRIFFWKESKDVKLKRGIR